MEWSPGPLRLALSEREEISRGLVAGETVRKIACQLGRAPSTVSREVKTNGGRSHYRAVRAHHGAYERARRPKMPKLAAGPLTSKVESWLEQWWSPQEIANRLRLEHPDDSAMWVEVVPGIRMPSGTVSFAPAGALPTSNGGGCRPPGIAESGTGLQLSARHPRPDNTT